MTQGVLMPKAENAEQSLSLKLPLNLEKIKEFTALLHGVAFLFFSIKEKLKTL